MMHRPQIPAPPHRGGCLCGSVRYSYADRAAFRHEKGELARYRKRGDSGREADYVRCANCGTRLWHEPQNALQFVCIVAGTLDDPTWVVPAAHIWTWRAAPSALIPAGVYACEQGPGDRAELIAAFNAVYDKS